VLVDPEYPLGTCGCLAGACNYFLSPSSVEIMNAWSYTSSSYRMTGIGKALSSPFTRVDRNVKAYSNVDYPWSYPPVRFSMGCINIGHFVSRTAHLLCALGMTYMKRVL
jgi:hypothetical protein